MNNDTVTANPASQGECRGNLALQGSVESKRVAPVSWDLPRVHQGQRTAGEVVLRTRAMEKRERHPEMRCPAVLSDGR